MMKKIGLLIAALMLSSAASAGLITDTITQNVYVGHFGNHDYTHNINDQGFALGSALSGTIAINIYDDDIVEGCIPFLGCIPDVFEVIVVTIDAFDFDTGGLVFGTGFSSGLEVEALATVNATGQLYVSIQSIVGDFYVGDSVLTVVTTDVPEPGTLSLLGLGLLGLGLVRRRLSA